jgi:hypothetical protein
MWQSHQLKEDGRHRFVINAGEVLLQPLPQSQTWRVGSED